jgi:hypothetical protein
LMEQVASLTSNPNRLFSLRALRIERFLLTEPLQDSNLFGQTRQLLNYQELDISAKKMPLIYWCHTFLDSFKRTLEAKST